MAIMVLRAIVHSQVLFVITSLLLAHHGAAQTPTDSPTPTPAPPTPVPVRVPPSDGSPLSNSAIVGIAVGITIAVFVGVFAFSKWYIARFEDRVTMGRRGQQAAALGPGNAADSGDDDADDPRSFGGAGRFDGLFVGQADQEERLPGAAGSPIITRRVTRAQGDAMGDVDHDAASEYFSPREADVGAPVRGQEMKRPKLAAAPRSRIMSISGQTIASKQTVGEQKVRSALDTDMQTVGVTVRAQDNTLPSAVSAAPAVQEGTHAAIDVRPTELPVEEAVAATPSVAQATTAGEGRDGAVDPDTLSDPSADPMTEHFDFA